MRSALRSFATLLLAVAVVTCVDSPVAPSSGAPAPAGRASIAFAPRFSAGATQAGAVYDLNGLLVNQVHVVVTLNGQTLADTSVAYSATDSSFSLALNVAADPGDQVSFSLQYLSGTTVLYSASGTATTFPVGGTAPANPNPVVLVPVGPGATAARVTVSPSAGSFPTTAPIPFGATVTDASNTAIAGALLSWTTSDPSLATIGATTGLLQPTGKRGSVTVSASTLNGVTGTAVVSLVPPPAKLVVISGNGQTGAAGAALAQPVIVQVQAADGIGASGQAVAFSLSGGTGTGASAGSVSPATVTTDGSGNAQTTVTLGTTTGTYTLTATSGTFTAPASETATAAAVATLTLVSGSGQTDSVKQQLPVPLVVKAADQFGNPKSGVVVTWARTAGTGTPSAPSTTTGSDGTTSVTYTFGATVGSETIAASAAGVTTPVTFSETATTGGAATITAVLGNGQLAAIGVALATPLTVRVVDASGNPVTGAHVTWTITNGTLPTSQATTDATGQATATVVTGQTTGPLTVTATLVTGASVQFSETVTSGLPAAVRFTGNPSNVASGAAITPAVQVTVTDAGGNPVTIVSSSVTLTLTGGTGGAVLSGTLTEPTVNGVATFSNLSVNLAGSGYALVATVSGLTPAPSAPFAVTGAVVGVATQIAQNGGSVTGTVGLAVATPPSVIVKDANNNPVAGVPVTFAVASGGGSITGGAQTTNASGIATVGSWTLGNAVGTNTLTATSAGLTGSPVTFTASSVAGTATKLVFAQGPAAGTANVGSATPLIVAAQDALGNPAPSFAGTVSLALTTNPGSAALAFSGPTQSGGITTFTNLLVSAAGVGYVITASASGLTSAVSGPFTIAAASPAIIQWTNSFGGSWSAPGNWSLARAPISTDSVVIAASGTYTVTLDTTFTGKSIVVGGGSGTQTLSISSRSLTLSNQLTIANGGAFNMTGSQVLGTAPVLNQGTGTVTLTNSYIGTAFDNRGTIVVVGGSEIYGALTAEVSSTLLVESACGSSTMTVNNGFTNNGAIQLTALGGCGAYPTAFTVTTGALTNSSTGTITAVAGAGSSRSLGAVLNNEGTINVNAPLTIGAAGAAHFNTGTINVNASLTLNQSGTGPSFTSTGSPGSIAVASGQMFTVNGGTFMLQSTSTLSGAGGLTLNGVTATLGTSLNGLLTGSLTVSNSTVTLGAILTDADMGLSISNSTFNGTQSLVNATGQSLTIVASTINTPLTNAGTLIASGTNTFSGVLTTATGSTLIVAQVDGSASTAALSVPQGFGNNGTLELTSMYSSAYGATLNVAAGMVNGGTIAVLGGQTPGGARTLNAQLINATNGTMNVNAPMTWSEPSANHSNSGIINVNANLTLNQSGVSPAFINTGTIAVASGQVFAVSGGSFNLQTGTALSGAGNVSLLGVTNGTLTGVSVATLGLTSCTLSLSTSLSNAAIALSIINTTINGPGTLTNATGQTLTLAGSTNIISAPVVNQGTLIASGNTTLSGGLTTVSGSTLEVAQVDGSMSNATLSLPTGFTNNGAIQLSNAFSSAYGAVIIVNGGTITDTLVNAVGGTISVLGGETPGGARTINGQIRNRGTMTVSVPLTINSTASAADTNSGTINANANVTLSQSGGGPPSFTNTGTITVASGQLFSVTLGGFKQPAGGTLGGSGGLSLNAVTATFGDSLAISALTTTNGSTVSVAAMLNTLWTTVSLSNSTLSGTGTLYNYTGKTVTLLSSTVTVPVANYGTILASGTSAINGGFGNNGGATLEVAQADASVSTATLTIATANGFTNYGTIELSNAYTAAYGAALTVTGGALTNSGAITVLGGQTPGGARTLTAPLVDNQGTLNVYPDTIGTFAVNGGLTFESTSTLDLAVGGTTAGLFDVVAVTGALTLNGGTLNVVLRNNFNPTYGQSFTALTSTGTTTGMFTSTNLPAPIGPWSVQYNTNSIVLMTNGGQWHW